MEQIFHIITEMAPYLLLGFFFAGLMHVFVPARFYTNYLADNSLRSVLYATLLGIPLPLCSCGVLPTALSLHKEGGSKGATTAFLIATPQTGVDSILATYSLMGLPMAIIRPIAALITALGGGTMANVLTASAYPQREGKAEIHDAEATEHACCCGHEEKEKEEACCCCGHEEEEKEEACCCCGHEEKEKEESCCCCGHEEKEKEESCCCCGHEEKEKEEACCCSNHEEEEKEESCCCCGHEEKEKEESCCCHEEKEESCCCCHHEEKEEANASFGGKLISAFRYAFIDMLDDIGHWLVLGLVVAALITVFVPNDFFAIFASNTWLSMLLVLLISVPMYICATGSIPIAVALMLKGLSPGTAFVMLMAGPACNIASILLIRRRLGTRTLMAYLGSIIVGALLTGVVIDQLLPREWFAVANNVACCHEGSASWLEVACAVVLIVLLIVSYMRRLAGKKKKCCCG